MLAETDLRIATGLSPSVVVRSNTFAFRGLSVLRVLQPRRLRGDDGLGYSRFARHYYGSLG